MRVLVAPDKFKGSLGAAQVAEQIAAGLHDVLPEAEITLLPLADGGEGTAEIICSAAHGERFSCAVQDALGRPVEARYCVIGDKVAVIDVSAACGLSNLPIRERDPDLATSFGVGELLLDVVRGGAQKILVGLGGSATNDGGFGMARALGFRFLDHSGNELRARVSSLAELQHIEPKQLRWPEIIAAADVGNPLLGARGATRVFATQKGARKDQLDTLEAALERLADVVARELGTDFRETPGAGAAGGLGFGLMSFCGATMAAGFDVVAKFIGLEEAIQGHDLIITGEGRLDRQTLEGKAPAGVARLARECGKGVYAVVGEVEATVAVRELFDGVYPLVDGAVGPTEANREASHLLRERARELARSL